MDEKFVGRWPELRVIKPRSLEQLRAKNTPETTVTEYFDELENVLTKYSLKDKPHLIFDVDEKGITQDHTPPSVVAGKERLTATCHHFRKIMHYHYNWMWER